LKPDGWKLTASSFDPHWHGYQPEQLLDRSESRSWRAKEPGPAWCQIEFPEPIDLDDGELVWPSGVPTPAYCVEISIDGATWRTIVENDTRDTSERHGITLRTRGTKALRILVNAGPSNVAEITELHLFDGSPMTRNE
jgi:hypothetical protein